MQIYGFGFGEENFITGDIIKLVYISKKSRVDNIIIISLRNEANF